MEPSDKRQMTGDEALRHEVAALLRDGLEEICRESTERFMADYPTQQAVLPTYEHAWRRGFESYETLVQTIEANEPSLYQYYEYSQDKAIPITEPTFSPVVNFCVGVMYAGRHMAAYLNRTLGDRYDMRAAAIGIVEDMIERIVAFNLRLYADRLTAPGFLARYWMMEGMAQQPVAEAPASRPAASAWDALSPRELDVLRLITKGLSNGEIAGALNIRQNTVKAHVGNLFAKLGVTNRTELTVAALKHGIS